MPISAKKQREILDAVSDAFHAVIKEQLPFVNEGGPDVWNEEEKARFDLLTETEIQVKERVRACFPSPKNPPTAPHA